MIKKLLKLEQVGRILFLKGLWSLEPNEIVPDSKSSEYYFFILQHSRVALCNLQSSLTTKYLLFRPWRFFIALILLPFKFMQLKFANEIAQAYINESNLLRASHESR
jgi:hypothetical protein